MPNKYPIVEVCLDAIGSALIAEKNGASRVELCDNLVEGGTTPSAGMIKLVKDKVTIPIMVIIRPRGGDFCYSEDEFEIMKYDIRIAKDLGVYGVVFGILKEKGSVDIERNKILLEIARPMKTTFHRAFDVARDPHGTLETLIEIGFDRVLTSGQTASVPAGINLIAELVKQAGDRIIVMPGGGITEENIRNIVQIARPKELHFSAAEITESKMTFENPLVDFGYRRKMTSACRLRDMIEQATKEYSQIM